MNNTFSAALGYLGHAFQVITENKLTSTFAGVSAAVLNLVMHSIQLDIYILAGMILMIGLNTASGIRKAKKDKRYSTKELRESVVNKTIGYTMLLTGVALLCIILFIAGLRDDIKLADDYWFNLPVVVLMVFLSTVEFKSLIENLEYLGITIPGFVKRIPEQVQDKIDDLTDLTKGRS